MQQTRARSKCSEYVVLNAQLVLMYISLYLDDKAMYVKFKDRDIQWKRKTASKNKTEFVQKNSEKSMSAKLENRSLCFLAENAYK